MSSSILKDLAAIRERQITENRRVDEMFTREEERMLRERPWEPSEIIWESEWHQGFGSECKEHLGKDVDGFYYGLEKGEGDISWNGPYKTREQAEDQLESAYNRWEEKIGEHEAVWEAEQIAELEQQQGIEI
jgi:hypothetical protein